MQTCRGCGIKKEYTEFYKDSSNKTGFKYKCKICLKSDKKVYY